MNDLLRSAIDAVYAAFKSVPKPQHIEGCPCCIEDKEVDVLLSKGLREITPSELSAYAASVFLTVGCESDYRYLLPRILEISALEPWWWPDIEVIGRSLSSAKWSTWAFAEKEAVGNYFEARFTTLLNTPGGSDLDSLLCGIALSGRDLSPYLQRITAVESAALAIYEQNANEIIERRLANGFWDNSTEGASQMIDWFYSTEVSLLILKSYGVDLNIPRPKGAS